MNLLYVFENFDFRCRQRGMIEWARRHRVFFHKLGHGDLMCYINRDRSAVLILAPLEAESNGVLVHYKSPLGAGSVTTNLVQRVLGSVGARAIGIPAALRNRLDAAIEEEYTKRAA